MHDILAKSSRGVLADFAYSNVLLGFDFDGTLAPIVAQPSRARMRATTRRLLTRVAISYPCVVISGRTRGDLSNRLGRLPLWHLFGNHGLEPWAETKEALAQVRDWVRHLRRELDGHPGVVVQDKRYSVTVHYRHAPHPGRAHDVIVRVVAQLSNARVLEGDHAVNLLQRDGANKGEALQRSRQILACASAIYVGDDGVDEDAFGSGPAHELLAIRVCKENTSRARYYLRSQAHVDRLLRTLISMRSRGLERRGKLPGSLP
ncbi:MAG: trehalose-phosphatase [Vicinamibacterales bacterium]